VGKQVAQTLRFPRQIQRVFTRSGSLPTSELCETRNGSGCHAGTWFEVGSSFQPSVKLPAVLADVNRRRRRQSRPREFAHEVARPSGSDPDSDQVDLRSRLRDPRRIAMDWISPEKPRRAAAPRLEHDDEPNATRSHAISQVRASPSPRVASSRRRRAQFAEDGDSPLQAQSTTTRYIALAAHQTCGFSGGDSPHRVLPQRPVWASTATRVTATVLLGFRAPDQARVAEEGIDGRGRSD
jgi:hypothetical protein